ncbi:hematopoietic SH2 domain-containing protein [Spea bombifrons]|uniref:hematopoietic SH2 domain-containing protein n=1 Tax=Spea bombifrons TaxID=233779 RepID=UPI0023498714|nr:hematopoietic SH2 domain-containing protein [Spea bombifrons]
MEATRASIQWFIETQSEWFLKNGIPDWFHGVITRKQAESLLKDRCPGSFLIRVSESRIGYSLSYRSKDHCKHFMIDVSEGQKCNLSGDARIHMSLQDLITFHKIIPIYPYNEMLTQPCGQETNSTTDYEELFWHKKAHATNLEARGSDEKSMFPFPLNNPVHGKPRTELDQESPPVPPRKRNASLPQVPEISTALPGPVGRLYPSVPQETPTAAVGFNQNHCSRLPKSNNEEPFLLPNTQAKARCSNTTINSPQHNGKVDPEFEISDNTSTRSRKPIKAGYILMTKAASLVTDGQIAQGFKTMENTVATHIKNMKQISQGIRGNNCKPEEYKKPPPFAPGF